MFCILCRSLDTLFDSPKLDGDLKAMLKANFSEFYSQGIFLQMPFGTF